jgi:hypothetical protein
VLYQHESHTRIARQCAQQLGERFQPACGRADGRNQKWQRLISIGSFAVQRCGQFRLCRSLEFRRYGLSQFADFIDGELLRGWQRRLFGWS